MSAGCHMERLKVSLIQENQRRSIVPACGSYVVQRVRCVLAGLLAAIQSAPLYRPEQGIGALDKGTHEL